MYTGSLHAFFSAFRGSPLQALVTSDDAAESLPALLADADGVYGTLTPELLAAVCETPRRAVLSVETGRNRRGSGCGVAGRPRSCDGCSARARRHRPLSTSGS
jgi:hypothetical protein